MNDPTYAVFSALDPFFYIVKLGLEGLVDGDHGDFARSLPMRCSSFEHIGSRLSNKCRGA